MPVPEPRSGEEKSEIVSRCISFLNDEGTTGDQAVASCYSQWRNARPDEDSKNENSDN